MKKVLIKPHITEKTILLTKQNKYTFVVAKNARKEEIKKWVENLFKVKVESINTLKNAPELKRNYRTGSYFLKGGLKKAIVKIKGDKKIDLFELESKEPKVKKTSKKK
ncbi:MAG TPA: 50S ribosomal protein L23 [candidate division WWE3 bacterium]|uniref:Large ribosomal subunit protein uL23 n=1 Tax=candidate division WWE3 bacterium TaxID=2053526 RepID=A0A7V5J0T5_UNCKA|nr:50S ribosomal protein L23 [candidate division WWE3 bacterium]